MVFNVKNNNQTEISFNVFVLYPKQRRKYAIFCFVMRMIKKCMQGTFYCNFSHFSHFRDGSLVFPSFPWLWTKRRFKRYKASSSWGCSKLNTVHYHIHSELSAFSAVGNGFREEKRKTYKKGTRSTSILLCLCLWCHFDYFILVQL